MTTPIQITTHVADGQARLMTQYVDKPLFTGALAAFTAQFQALEDAFIGVQATNDPNNATGIQLDRFGAIVGLPRPSGMSDSTYLILALAQVGINTSQGTPEAVIASFSILTGSARVDLNELYPAAITLMGSGQVTALSVADLTVVIQSILSAGVSLDSIGYFDPTNPFVFEGGVGGGMGDASDPTVGGVLAGLYST